MDAIELRWGDVVLHAGALHLVINVTASPTRVKVATEDGLSYWVPIDALDPVPAVPTEGR